MNSSFGQKIETSPYLTLSENQKIWRRVRFKLRIIQVLAQLLKEVRSYPGNSPILACNSENTERKKIFKKATKFLVPAGEESTVELMPCGVLSPNTSGREAWNLVLVAILMYSAIFTPFFLAFGDGFDQNTLFWLENSVNVLFFVDFILNCCTAFYDENQVLIINRRKILGKYLKSWFFVDFLSWFPFEFIIGTAAQSSKTAARFIRIPKLYRLFRISRLMRLFNSSFQQRIIDKFQEMLNVKNSVMRMIKTFISIVICVHIFSCFWYLLAKLEDFTPTTWVFVFNYQDSDIPTLYITCVYWAITTFSTCGYGDITPTTMYEQIFAMVWMAVSIYFFSFTISNLNAMLSSYDLKENALTYKLAAIDEFASESNLNPSLRRKLKHCLRYAAEKRGFSWNEKMNIVTELPKQLRYEIAINMHKGAAKKLNFFCNKDQGFVALIVPLLDPIFVDKNCLVYKEGDFADEIYFLVKGNVRIALDVNAVIKSVQKGCYFGDVEVLLGGLRRFSAYSMRHSDMLIMNKSVIGEIRDNNLPVWYEIFEVAETRQEQYERALIEIKEMEKVYKGTLFTKESLNKFKKRVDEILKERLKSLNKKPEMVSPGLIVKKLDLLIQEAAKKKLNLDNIDFLKEMLEYSG